jgi:hypothetical protein
MLFSRAIIVPARPHQKDGFKWICAACSNRATNGEDVQLLAPKAIDYYGHDQFADHITSDGHRNKQNIFLKMLDERGAIDHPAPGLVLTFMSRVHARRKQVAEQKCAEEKEEMKKRVQEHEEKKSTKKRKTTQQGDLATCTTGMDGVD